MTILIVSLVAFFASLLTFFSGFGLGTLLTPVFALWFPLDLSIALTAIVHFLNNLFKLSLVGKHANRSTVLRFGIPAVAAAAAGAWIMTLIADLPPIGAYIVFEQELQIYPFKVIIGLLILVFTLFEALPSFRNWTIEKKYIAVGGALSGFFGGLSGHQGALRSAFLIKAGLSKQSFIATGVVIACFVDVVRLGFYSKHFAAEGIAQNSILLVLTTSAAFAGAYVGSKTLNKVTMNSVQKIVSICLIIFAFGLAVGLI